MSKIIQFLDKLVEFPLRWTADIDTAPAAIENLTRDPGTVYQAGTANKAEYFNAIQENGVYSVDSTINVAGSVTTYTITNFLTEGTFTIYDGFKLSMKSSGNNVGVTKIDLLGTVYDVKLASNGSYIDSVDDDIKTNEIVNLEYRNGVFILSSGSYLPKGDGLSTDYNTAKKIEDQIEKLYDFDNNIEVHYDGPQTTVQQPLLPGHPKVGYSYSITATSGRGGEILWNNKTTVQSLNVGFEGNDVISVNSSGVAGGGSTQGASYIYSYKKITG